MTREEAIFYIKELQKTYAPMDKKVAEAVNLAIEALKDDWTPVSKGYPKDLEEVNVTWVNHNPPVYYKHERDKPHTAVAVLYQGRWYWWDSTITDTLAEYGDRACAEPIDKDISILAWQPLPKPYKESDTE